MLVLLSIGAGAPLPPSHISIKGNYYKSDVINDQQVELVRFPAFTTHPSTLCHHHLGFALRKPDKTTEERIGTSVWGYKKMAGVQGVPLDISFLFYVLTTPWNATDNNSQHTARGVMPSPSCCFFFSTHEEGTPLLAALFSFFSTQRGGYAPRCVISFFDTQGGYVPPHCVIHYSTQRGGSALPCVVVYFSWHNEGHPPSVVVFHPSTRWGGSDPPRSVVLLCLLYTYMIR